MLFTREKLVGDAVAMTRRPGATASWIAERLTEEEPPQIDTVRFVVSCLHSGIGVTGRGNMSRLGR
jgi:hypothetical protein